MWHKEYYKLDEAAMVLEADNRLIHAGLLCQEVS